MADMVPPSEPGGRTLNTSWFNYGVKWSMAFVGCGECSEPHHLTRSVTPGPRLYKGGQRG